MQALLQLAVASSERDEDHRTKNLIRAPLAEWSWCSVCPTLAVLVGVCPTPAVAAQQRFVDCLDNHKLDCRRLKRTWQDEQLFEQPLSTVHVEETRRRDKVRGASTTMWCKVFVRLRLVVESPQGRSCRRERW